METGYHSAQRELVCAAAPACVRRTRALEGARSCAAAPGPKPPRASRRFSAKAQPASPPVLPAYKAQHAPVLPEARAGPQCTRACEATLCMAGELPWCTAPWPRAGADGAAHLSELIWPWLTILTTKGTKVVKAHISSCNSWSHCAARPRAHNAWPVRTPEQPCLSWQPSMLQPQPTGRPRHVRRCKLRELARHATQLHSAQLHATQLNPTQLHTTQLHTTQ